MSNEKAIWEKSVFPFDSKAIDALNWADSHADAARDALLMAAEYMRRGEALPPALAQYLCEAIECAMAKDNPKERARALTTELKLTAINRRPKGYWLDIGGDACELLDSGATQDSAFAEVAEKYNTSPDTVRNYWREYDKASKEYDRLQQDYSK